MNVNCQSSSIFYKFDSEAVRDGIFFFFFFFLGRCASYSR